MSDVAQILAGAEASFALANANSSEPSPFRNRNVSKDKLSEDGPKKSKKKMSRELAGLVGDSTTELLPSIVPTKTLVLGGLKAKRDAHRAKHWVWKAFTSSARKDGAQFYHWIRADAEFPDYPFARFNKKVDIVRYTDQEYSDLLTPAPDKVGDQNDQDGRWPRDHTDLLFELCRRYDLRWPVIADRFDLKPPHAVEDMKLRFYTVTTRIIQARLKDRDPAVVYSVANVKGYHQYAYKPEIEQKRRKQLDAAFRRPPETLQAERELLKELKDVETQIKEMQRGGDDVVGSNDAVDMEADLVRSEGRHGEALFPNAEALAIRNLAQKQRQPYVYTATASGAVEAGADGSRRPSAGRAPTTDVDPFVGVAFRSAQIAAPVDGMAPDSKTLVKVNMLLRDMNVPDKPLPSAQVFAAMQQLRREAMDFISLGKAADAAEQEVLKLHAYRRELGLKQLPQSRPVPSSGTVLQLQQQQQQANQSLGSAAGQQPGAAIGQLPAAPQQALGSSQQGTAAGRQASSLNAPVNNGKNAQASTRSGEPAPGVSTRGAAAAAATVANQQLAAVSGSAQPPTSAPAPPPATTRSKSTGKGTTQLQQVSQHAGSQHPQQQPAQPVSQATLAHMVPNLAAASGHHGLAVSQPLALSLQQGQQLGQPQSGGPLASPQALTPQAAAAMNAYLQGGQGPGGPGTVPRPSMMMMQSGTALPAAGAYYMPPPVSGMSAGASSPSVMSYQFAASFPGAFPPGFPMVPAMSGMSGGPVLASPTSTSASAQQMQGPGAIPPHMLGMNMNPYMMNPGRPPQGMQFPQGPLNMSAMHQQQQLVQPAPTQLQGMINKQGGVAQSLSQGTQAALTATASGSNQGAGSPHQASQMRLGQTVPALPRSSMTSQGAKDANVASAPPRPGTASAQPPSSTGLPLMQQGQPAGQQMGLNVPGMPLHPGAYPMPQGIPANMQQFTPRGPHMYMTQPFQPGQGQAGPQPMYSPMVPQPQHQPPPGMQTAGGQQLQNFSQVLVPGMQPMLGQKRRLDGSSLPTDSSQIGVQSQQQAFSMAIPIPTGQAVPTQVVGTTQSMSQQFQSSAPSVPPPAAAPSRTTKKSRSSNE